MATYFTDSWSSLTGWTSRWRGDSWTAAGDITAPSGGAGDWNGLTQDSIDSDSNRANVDVLAVVRVSSIAARRYPLVVRGSGADEAATNYSAAISSTTIRIYYCNGADAPTQVTSASATATFAVDTDYWIRLRCQGSALKIKYWTGEAGDEPGGVASDSSWSISVTDSTVTAAGWVGVSAYAADGVTTFKQFGAGTGGDWAPSSAGGTNATATLTGAANTSASGTLTATGAASAALTGATTASAAGTVSASAGSNAAATLTGAASASSAGTITAAGAAEKTLVGASAAASAGTVSATAGGNAGVTLTGTSAATASGALVATGGAAVTLPGATSASSAGTVSASSGTNATGSLTGASVSATVGALSATGAAQIVITGVSVVAAAGAVSAAGASANATASIAGAYAAAAAGTLSAAGSIWTPAAPAAGLWTPAAAAAGAWTPQ